MWSLLLIGTMSFANGNRVGNGGTGIACEHNGHREVQILDLFENTLPLAPFDNTKTPLEILEPVLKNLSRLAPTLGQQYTRRAGEIMGELEFKKEALLTPTEDALQLALPKDKKCTFEQIAIRREKVDLLTKRFLVSEDLWKEMDHLNQAALLLHEIIYEHLFKLHEKDSGKARKLVGYVLSQQAIGESPDQFWALIKSLSLPIYR